MSGSPHWQRNYAVWQLHGSVSAVLDDNGLRRLGNSAGSIPGHALASQAVEGHGGELGLQDFADLAGVHIAVDVTGEDSLVDGVDNVVSVSSELVRSVAVSVNISGNESLGLLVLCVSSERSQQHQALSQRGVEALDGEDAVHAVAAEEGRGVAGLVGDDQDLRSFLIVDGQEDQISASLLALGNLGGQVRLVVGSEGLIGDDLQALLSSLSLELIMNAAAVSIGRVVDDADLGGQLVICDVVSRSNALVGVGEADLENIVAGVDDVNSRGRRGHHEHVVVGSLSSNG